MRHPAATIVHFDRRIGNSTARLGLILVPWMPHTLYTACFQLEEDTSLGK